MTTLQVRSPAAPRRRPPWYLLVPGIACALGVAVPLAYLVVQAVGADEDMLRLLVWRPRNLGLLVNTLGLAAAVLAVVSVLAIPIAWLTARTDLPGRRWCTLLAVMPLAVPGYLLAYTLLAVGGDVGTGATVLGVRLPRLTGFWGALVALSLYNLPYMFLNLRVALNRTDPAQEEAARSLGHSPWSVFTRVTLPQLKPAYLAGALLVVLHVIGDFGVVSLMRFDTFSLALYNAYEMGDGISASWFGLALVVVAGILLALDWRFLRGLRLDPVGVTTPRVRRPVHLGRWALAAYGLILTVVLLSVAIPVATMAYWATNYRPTGVTGEWGRALVDSLSGSLPAAALATLLAIPVAYLASRYRSRWSRALEQSAYIGYAIPSMALALGLVLLSVGWPVYQSLTLLVGAYALHFLAEAIGPVRSALYVATPRLEEAAQSLGYGRFKTLTRVTLPLLRPGLLVSLALVFLSTMKELALTIILAPTDFQTLATRVWDYTNGAQYGAAAPYALTLVGLGAGFVALLLVRGYETNG